MKTIYQIILEMCFKKKDFDKHFYAQDVIQHLCTEKVIRLGKKGETEFEIDPSIQDDLKKDFDKLGRNVTVEDFNRVVKKYGLPEWTKIFKGVFSGYIDGLITKNSGIQFEQHFVEHFKDYQADIEKVLKLKPGTLDRAEVSSCGSQNNRRPLQKLGNDIVIGDPNNVGKDVKDVLVITIDGQQYYISLKSGDCVSFCNIGIKELFPDAMFKDGRFESITKNNVNNRELLDLFGIEWSKMLEVFNKYSKPSKREKSEKETVNVKEKMNQKEFMKFLGSVIGHNYILVHKNKNKFHVYNLLTKNDMEKFIGEIQEAGVYYPIDGKAKRIDVVILTNTLKLTFEIRSKTGGIYPDCILCKYSIL